MIDQRSGGEPQRQRVTMGEPIDPIGICPVDPGLAKQGIGILAWEIGERETPEQRAQGARPIRHRRFATGEDRPHVFAEARDEGRPKPRVEGPEDLVSIENKDDTIAKFGQPDRGVGRGQQIATDDARDRGRNPRSVGSISPQSRRTTIAPLDRASLE